MEEQSILKLKPTNVLPKLISISDLFSSVIKVYFSRFGLFFGISILPGAVWFVGKIIKFYYPPDAVSVPISLLVIALFLVSSLLSVLSVIALIYAIPRPTSIVEAYKFSTSKLFSFLWLGLINTLMIFGGLVLFVIPGIVVAVWLSFSSFILIYENLNGFNALFKSKAYVRGYFFPVFGRIIFPIAIIFGLSFFLGVLFGFGSNLIESVITARNYDFFSSSLLQLVSVFFLPFIMIYQYVLYHDLASKKIKTMEAQPKENKKSFILVCILGLISIPIFISISSIIGIPSSSVIIRDQKRYSDLLQIQSRIQLYHMDRKQYPISLDELTPKYFNFTPKDPLTGNAYDYRIILNGDGYEVCSRLESNLSPACITSSSTKSNKSR